MNYNFPRIHHINDVLPVIKDRKEFIVAERDWYTIINYMVVFEDTFPPVETNEHAILRECRGIAFDKNGFIISRPYHKFFNINEREETKTHMVNMSKPYIILDKLDGSMIRPLYNSEEQKFYLATKMGVTDVAKQAAKVFLEKKNYIDLFYACLIRNYTPIFEYVSPYNKIVVDYFDENLILTAIRDNITGIYLLHSELKFWSEKFNIPLVDVVSMQHEQQNNVEGSIYRFDNGHMFKSKTEWYVLLHKAKDIMMNEKNIAFMILEEKFDDFIANVDANYHKKLAVYKKSFQNAIFSWCENLTSKVFKSIKTSNYDRKTFALTETDPYVKQCGFKCWDMIIKNDVYLLELKVFDYMKELILKHHTNKDFEKIKSVIFPNVKYDIIVNESEN